MKGRSLLLSAILFLVAGLILILTYRTTKTDGVVIVGGIMFIVSGLLNIFAYMADRPGKKEIEAAINAGRKPRSRSSLSSAVTWISSGAAVILGVSLLIFTSTFTPLVPFVFALLITMAALYQFYLLAIGCRPLRLPAWLFAAPVLMLGGAIYVFIQKPGLDHTEQIIMLVTGISFVLFGIAMLAESILIGTANRKALRQASAPAAESGNHESVAGPTNSVIEVKALDDHTTEAP